VETSAQRSFAINPATIKLPLGAKRTGEVTVTVTNSSGAFKKGFVRCMPQGSGDKDQKRPDIEIDGEKERPFEKGAAQQFKIKVSAKPEVKEGTYQFRVDVANSADPEGDWTEGPVIEITAPKVGVEAPTPGGGPKWWIFLIVGAAVLLIGGVVLFFVFRNPGKESVEVPNLVGMTFEEAEKAAAAANLKVDIAEAAKGDGKKDEKKEEKKDEPKKDEKKDAKDDFKKEDKKESKDDPKKEEKKDDKTPEKKQVKGKVTSQDPAAGEKAEAESTIALVFSKEETHPSSQADIPSVKGMTIEQAKLVLYEKGFTPKVGPAEFKGSTPGTIIEQKPAAGTKAEHASEVTIVPEKENIVVPSLAEKPLKDAVFELNRLRLIGQVTYQTVTGPVTDHVIDQNPKAGTRVEVNSNVTLTVPRGMIIPVISKEQLRVLHPAMAAVFATVNSISGITLSPPSPANFRRVGSVTVSFHYSTSLGDKAKIHVMALIGGKMAPGTNELVLSTDASGKGDLKGVVFFRSPCSVDSIHIKLVDPDGRVLYDESVPVKYTFMPF
jgi:beta-lactam-binding protein with PASTA domain